MRSVAVKSRLFSASGDQANAVRIKLEQPLAFARFLEQLASAHGLVVKDGTILGVECRYLDDEGDWLLMSTAAQFAAAIDVAAVLPSNLLRVELREQSQSSQALAPRAAVLTLPGAHVQAAPQRDAAHTARCAALLCRFAPTERMHPGRGLTRHISCRPQRSIGARGGKSASSPRQRRSQLGSCACGDAA